ncbi:MAG: ParA family protein [Planctomycetes bacterium]|nr:ParA family protein [Planctomycetota bacterium]
MSIKVIVSATNKGGDGKTKLSILMAEYLSSVKGLKGLGIDLDPQCNFSSRFLEMEIDSFSKHGKTSPIHPDYDPNHPDDKDWDGRSSIAGIFFGESVFPYPTHIPTFEIAPASASKLVDAEAVTKQEVAEKVHKQLKLFVNLDEVKETYDYIVIDTPPAKGPLTISAFKAATHLLIPTQMEQYSVHGIYGMLQLWKQEMYCRSQDDPIHLVGVLPNMIRNINLHKDFYDGLKQTPGIGEYILPYSLKQRAVYAEVDVESASPRTIFDYPGTHEARKESEAVCNEIYRRIFNHE